MFSKVYTGTVLGVQTFLVCVEADVSSGMPCFEMVGNLSAQVKEAKDRVKVALKNSLVSFPIKRIMVSLSPSEMKKEGSHFDLPIAISLLISFGFIDEKQIEQLFFIGELGLNGQLCKVRGALALVELAQKKGFTQCILPKENEKEGSFIQGIQVIALSSLEEVIEYLQNKRSDMNQAVEQCEKKRNEEIYFIQQHHECDDEGDFADIRGQLLAKRASAIAAAGFHHILYIGEKGIGKTMLAKRLIHLLPPLEKEDCIEVSKMYSICGLLSKEKPFLTRRPFRVPHHTISLISFTGGGRNPLPGEITLANKGILFLDELPEFKSEVLESLRQPLEEKSLWVSRLYGRYEFPADFLLAAAMNPCRCGYYPDRNRCSCSISSIKQYFRKLSGPLLDRFDLCVEMSRISYDDLYKIDKQYTTEYFREQVNCARMQQKIRYQQENIEFNSQLSAAKVERYCKIGQSERNFLKKMFRERNWSIRGYHKILKVARTIADMEKSEEITILHLREAICYRKLEQDYGEIL
ncbi:Fis family transcriptional regulator [Clostridia bacterium]|nr:Fis family transcriptional regulator [Clostridia bacterium]